MAYTQPGSSVAESRFCPRRAAPSYTGLPKALPMMNCRYKQASEVGAKVVRHCGAEDRLIAIQWAEPLADFVPHLGPRDATNVHQIYEASSNRLLLFSAFLQMKRIMKDQQRGVRACRINTYLFPTSPTLVACFVLKFSLACSPIPLQLPTPRSRRKIRTKQSIAVPGLDLNRHQKVRTLSRPSAIPTRLYSYFRANASSNKIVEQS